MSNHLHSIYNKGLRKIYLKWSLISNKILEIIQTVKAKGEFMKIFRTQNLPEFWLI